MPPVSSPWLEPVDQLLLRDQYEEAEKLLNQLVNKSESRDDANALLAAIKLWTQREFQVFNHLVNAPHGRDYAWALELATKYFTARKQMAKKQNFHDPEGEKELTRIESLEGNEPINENLIGITACLIVKNEAENLPRCLDSLKGIVDEIVVVDTGSTDETVKIAKTYGAILGEFEWCHDFSAARNASIELATQPWILWIDADEELQSSSHRMLQEALMRPQFGGYQIQIINFTDSKNLAQQFVHTPLRVFVNHPKVRFTGKIHEQIVGGILDLGLKSATLNGVSLNHYGYTEEMMEDRDKINRTINMLLKEIDEDPNFSFNWFNLANSYAVAKRFKDAAEAAQKCIDTLTSKAAYVDTAYDVLAAAYLELGEYDKCLNAISQAEKSNHHTILTEFSRMNAYLRLGKISHAIESGKACLQMEWRPGLTGDYGVASFKRYVQFARALAQDGQYEEALKHISHSLEVNQQNSGAWGIKGAIQLKNSQALEALESLSNCIPFNLLDQISQTQLTSSQTDAIPLIVEAALLTQNYQLAKLALALANCNEVHFESWLAAIQKTANPEGLNLLDNHFDQIWAKQRISKSYLEFSKPELALQVIAKTLRILPDDPEGWFITGDAAYQLGRYLEAAENYQHGLTLAPEHAEGWFVLANSMAQLGANSAALNLYKECLKLNPNHEKALHNLEIVKQDLAA